MTSPVRGNLSRPVSALEQAFKHMVEPRMVSASSAEVSLRAPAARFLLDRGLPSGKEEAWRHTSLAEVMRRQVSHPSFSGMTLSDRGSLASQGVSSLYVIDGRPVPQVVGLPEGIEVKQLRQVLAEEPDQVIPTMLRWNVGEDGFRAFNQAVFDDGWVIRVRAGAVVEAPLELIVCQALENAPTISTPRILCLLEPGAGLRLVERHISSGARQEHVSVGVMQVVLGERAKLDHCRLVHCNDEASFWVTQVEAKAQATYRVWSGSIEGRFRRWDLEVDLAGEAARCEISGLYLGAREEVVDHHVTVRHGAPRGRTEERFRGVVAGKAQAVFAGAILVGQDARASNAHQETRNLVLSPEARVHAKPQLEIDIDDVVCSHGATVGALDPEQLYYLMSRGLDETLARNMLTEAFVEELLAECWEPSVAAAVRGHLQRFASAHPEAKR